MFSTTFLGHQGWLFQSGRSCILADPLLCESFGAVHALEYRVHPPRRLDFASFPRVDAVILSHEHDDHFDVPSLARLDRRIPIHLSAHSSSAAFTILRDMGFDVRPLRPGIAVDVGDLQVIPCSGDHVNVNNADEWDALPYLVRDRFGAGSFFTVVDVALLSTHVQWAKAFAPRPGLVTWSNNSVDWSYMSDQLSRDVGTDQCLMRMGTDHKMIATEWGKPSAMLMCAGGFAFEGERAWLNQHLFWVDGAAVCAKLASMYRDEGFFDTLPGQTFRMQHNRLVGVDSGTPFLAAAARDTWPDRARRPYDRRDMERDYPPACGRRDLVPGDDEHLRRSLDELARALVGGILFRSQHSMLAAESGARKQTFALVLRHGEPNSTQVFEYDPSGCAFVPVDEPRPRDAYIAGFECWATDMLAALRGDMGPIALMFGRARIWNVLPQRFIFDLLEGLTRVSHPLVRPADYLRTYRRHLANERDAQPLVRASAVDATLQGSDATGAAARSAVR